METIVRGVEAFDPEKPNIINLENDKILNNLITFNTNGPNDSINGNTAEIPIDIKRTSLFTRPSSNIKKI
jgi:hypothetical protein